MDIIIIKDNFYHLFKILLDEIHFNLLIIPLNMMNLSYLNSIKIYNHNELFIIMNYLYALIYQQLNLLFIYLLKY